ncbi:MAG: head fiber protein [Bacillota bacterium]|nr:head fiber protein [Bacillota bacterium]
MYKVKQNEVQGLVDTLAGLGGSVDLSAYAKKTDIPKMPTQADSTATTIAGLVADFNALLAKLKSAGLMS